MADALDRGDDDGAPELSLVASDALVAELRRRFDGLLVVRERDTGPDESRLTIDFHGGLSRCIGLAARAEAVMTRDALLGEVVGDPDRPSGM